LLLGKSSNACFRGLLSYTRSVKPVESEVGGTGVVEKGEQFCSKAAVPWGVVFDGGTQSSCGRRERCKKGNKELLSQAQACALTSQKDVSSYFTLTIPLASENRLV